MCVSSQTVRQIDRQTDRKVQLVFNQKNIKGRPWPNRYNSCTTNVYKLDAHAGARGFNPELRHYASRVPSPCGLAVVYKISPPLKLGKPVLSEIDNKLTI